MPQNWPTQQTKEKKMDKTAFKIFIKSKKEKEKKCETTFFICYYLASN